jgi:hypothetical protein
MPTPSKAVTKAAAIPAIGVETDLQKMTWTPQFQDASGANVPMSALSGPPVYASADLTSVGLIPAADGSSCEVDGLVATGLNPDGSPATVGITCTGTNPDGTTAVISASVQVLASDAVGGSSTFGTPTTR